MVGNAWRRTAVLAVVCVCLGATRARAEDVFGVVSERQAARMVEAAAAFAERWPGHRLSLRTPEQLAELSDAQVAALWARSDALLFAGVFGDQAARLVRLLKAHPPLPGAPLLALHGDLSLTRLSRLGGRAIFEGLDSSALRALTTELGAAEEAGALRQRLMADHPVQAPWIEARGYWQAGGVADTAALLAWLVRRAGATIEVPAASPPEPVRFEWGGKRVELGSVSPDPGERSVLVLDYDSGGRGGGAQLHRALCQALRRRELACLTAFARWGEATVEALRDVAARKSLGVAAVVSLQDFVLGGGEGREAATEALASLDVPVIKAVHLHDRDAAAFLASEDGLPWDSVHYRVAMPELQGQSQPVVLAAAGPLRRDPDTGIAYHRGAVLDGEVTALADRLRRWVTLAEKPPAERRVAIVYYNHPPGRHNVGADNLDVPASLWEILQLLRRAGYGVRDLPADPSALLDAVQARGINLPEDGKALEAMAKRVRSLPAADYGGWFDQLPKQARREVEDGPLGGLLGRVEGALSRRMPEQARAQVRRVLGDVRHLLDGADHPSRDRAVDLARQLDEAYAAWIEGDDGGRNRVQALGAALKRTGIEGLRGWGAAPGDVMTVGDRVLVPGIELGNVFIGPQPPRGWELDEELLHANLAFPPTHQYLAYYHYLRDVWKADVVVHLGRHSTYEFLPGKRVGLTAGDFPRLVLGGLPSVYLYIVDGVGEGIQAKRRGQAVIVDHLTPSLSTTPLYDDLLELRQLVESFEAQSGGEAAQQRTVRAIRSLIGELDLREQLVDSMRAELDVRGIGFEQVDDGLLVHEVGHYLTELQERFMPFGLHVFGRDWKPSAVDRMLRSMAGEGKRPEAGWRRDLTRSPAAERRALLRALDGRFVPPGHGNDPVRTPHVLPTGRNFHALDGGLLPTRVAYELGVDLAGKARAAGRNTPEGSEALVLWASDTVRDEGAMVAFGLDMLGVRPVWNSRGILQGIERLELGTKRVRRDVTFVTSGLFRDLYANLLVWLDRSVLLALDGSSETLREAHPEVADALAGALSPLGEFRDPGREPLARNEVAQHWLSEVAPLLAHGDLEPAEAGRRASLRLFGNAPGGYGAGVNRLAERSGAWQQRGDLARAYVRRMGHAYGIDLQGEPAHDRFAAVLARTEKTYLGRASNLYGLLDNNDGFDYLGGLGLAVEKQRGRPPEAHVLQHADPQDATIQSLDRALMQELRGRHLNPQYLKALMQHGYAGARTMNAGFVENLWGWQVTRPDIVKPWVWDEVQRVFLQDGHGIGLDAFLADGQNVHVRTNMQAVLLVAELKGFWSPDEAQLKELSRDFAETVVEHGLPGSGHTRPDHPVMQRVAARLEPELRAAFERRLSEARIDRSEPERDPSHIRELQAEKSSESGDGSSGAALGASAALLVTASLFGAGYLRGRRQRGGE